MPQVEKSGHHRLPADIGGTTLQDDSEVIGTEPVLRPRQHQQPVGAGGLALERTQRVLAWLRRHLALQGGRAAVMFPHL